MAMEKTAHQICRLAPLAVVCVCLVLLGRGRVPTSQAVGGTLEQYLQSDRNQYVSGAVATMMAIDTRASYNIPLLDCSFALSNWTGVTEGSYNHFVQDGFFQYDNDTNYCWAGNTPQGWSPYGFTAFATSVVDCNCSGYVLCNYGYTPEYQGYDGSGYYFGCFYPFVSLGLVADHTYSWQVLLYENVSPMCFPAGCYSSYVELAVQDPSTYATYPLMYYADTGVDQINSNYWDANEIFSHNTDLTATGNYDDFTYMPQSFAYFAGSGWQEYNSNYFYLYDSLFVGPPSMYGETLCYSNPVVGMERSLGYPDILGGTDYPCN